MTERRHGRYQVHLAVRYWVADEFKREFAENLSAGGLFIRGAKKLEPEQKVSVEIELPGFGTLAVQAEVVHVITEEEATRTGRLQGAGLRMVQLPSHFDDLIDGYLHRLEARSERVVLVAHPPFELILEKAGYQTRPAPDPDDLVSAIAHAPAPVVGVVVPSALSARYETAARSAGAGDVVFAMDSADQAGSILARLDIELL